MDLTPVCVYHVMISYLCDLIACRRNLTFSLPQFAPTWDVLFHGLPQPTSSSAHVTVLR